MTNVRSGNAAGPELLATAGTEHVLPHGFPENVGDIPPDLFASDPSELRLTVATAEEQHAVGGAALRGVDVVAPVDLPHSGRFRNFTKAMHGVLRNHGTQIAPTLKDSLGVVLLPHNRMSPGRIMAQGDVTSQDALEAGLLKQTANAPGLVAVRGIYVANRHLMVDVVGKPIDGGDQTNAGAPHDTLSRTVQQLRRHVAAIQGDEPPSDEAYLAHFSLGKLTRTGFRTNAALAVLNDRLAGGPLAVRLNSPVAVAPHRRIQAGRR